MFIYRTQKGMIEMGVTNSNKELNISQINCGGSFKIKLSLTAAPDIISNPTDIVLILDRSGSMAGSPLANLKNGAKKFIDIIDEATDGAKDGQIGSGSHIGICKFCRNRNTGYAVDNFCCRFKKCCGRTFFRRFNQSC